MTLEERMKKQIPVAILALGVAAAACSSNSKSSTGPNPPPKDTTTQTFHANLTARAVRPVGDTAIKGTGRASFVVKNDTVRYTISDTGLTSKITGITLNGPADTLGTAPAVYTFTVDSMGAPFTGTFSTLTGTATMDSLLAWMKSGRAYVTMSDSAHAGGVLRGQILTGAGTTTTTTAGQ